MDEIKKWLLENGFEPEDATNQKVTKTYLDWTNKTVDQLTSKDFLHIASARQNFRA